MRVHSKARAIGLYLSVVCGTLSGACARKEQPAPAGATPSWVTDTRITAKGARRVFDGNVELFVTIENHRSSAIRLVGIDGEGKVELISASGARSTVHPLSVGLAKPILLGPKQVLTTSLLFKPLDGEARSLRVFHRESAVPAKLTDNASSRPASNLYSWTENVTGFPRSAVTGRTARCGLGRPPWGKRIQLFRDRIAR